MKVVLQRVQRASVSVKNEIVGSIQKGLLVFVGYEDQDGIEDISWGVNKILNLRIFSDEDGKMNHSIRDIEGGLLLISQFTLHASTKKGNRPSFIAAARPEKAREWYNETISVFADSYSEGKIQKGRFGEHMMIDALNDGPVTICIDTKNKE